MDDQVWSRGIFKGLRGAKHMSDPGTTAGWGRRRRRVVTEVWEEEFEYGVDEQKKRPEPALGIGSDVDNPLKEQKEPLVENRERSRDPQERTKEEIARGVSQVSYELLAIRERLDWGWECLVMAVLPPGSITSWVAVQENDADEQGVAVMASYRINGGLLDESERQRLHGLGFRDQANEMGILELSGNLDEERTRKVVARRAVRAILEVYLPYLEDWDPTMDWSARLLNVDE